MWFPIRLSSWTNFVLNIYTNYFNHAIKFCKVYHVADDTNLVHFSKSVNKLNRYVNTDNEIFN